MERGSWQTDAGTGVEHHGLLVTTGSCRRTGRPLPKSVQREPGPADADLRASRTGRERMSVVQAT